ncbi:D-alanine--D-alanine ligase family protein [Rickettsiella grylli]|uniref:D-alanine--D-alanine ligase n=1 Tax=Rickettsiella grylli TaxID=59196 RepID=A8PM76_9COXI|nr:D-alanine--D-alanine ligase family protein [Rickettsiella grylli]EDP47056.1 D-alanine--D-alanine ligase (D-alanylalanine synthetase)(D-Ala-D-Ala ligase) [Rickettsiella grylli]
MQLEQSTKTKVAVLYGGFSAEHEISLLSAAAVIKNLDQRKFSIIPIGIDKQGRCFVNQLQSLYSGDTILLETENAQSFSGLAELMVDKKGHYDVVFPVLHGALGEDGTIQGLLDLMDIAYIGADVLGSAVGMDKVVSKRLACAAHIPVVPFLAFNSGHWLRNKSLYSQQIRQEIGYPLFIKPVNGGSSLGITKIKKDTDLENAIELVFTYSTKVLVEKALEVREVEIAVLENQKWGAEPYVSQIGEIIPRHEFYSYEAKYLDEKGAQLIIPASLQNSQLQQIKRLAIELFNGLDCSGMARIDFFIEKRSQKIYFNELNTIPGFTKISMYPRLWEVSGIAYTSLLTHLIELALTRHQRLSLLKLSF